MEPENPLLWLNLGIAQQRTGEYTEAIESFHRAVLIEDDLAEAWFSMGLIYYETKEFEMAEECYLFALDRNLHDPKIWNNLGVLHFTKGNFEKARQCFEDSVTLSPHFYDAIFNLRDTCRELGDYRAAAEFERALSGLNASGNKPAYPGTAE
jgi:tetratricopeptide (TPR) repeat protein